MDYADFPLSRKSQDIPPFLVMDVLERAMEMAEAGEDIIHLEVGEPDFDTPPNIIEAAAEAMRDGKTHYTPSTGTVDLRRAIAEHYGRTYGVEVDPQCVVVTSGSSPAILLVLSALLDPGCEIIVSDPHYACYPNFIRFLDGVPVFVDVSARDGFQINPDDVERAVTKKTRAVLINSPSNPTGTLLEAERMKRLVEMDLPVISDEIYHGLVYEGKERSILEFTNHAFVLNGFSKLYAMTGWRLGYLIAPLQYIRSIQKMAQNFFISASDFVQSAGVEALTNSSQHTAKMREIFNQRRIAMIARLKNMGFGIDVDPTAAFYVLADARRFSSDSYQFAFEILEEAGVGVAPGIDFGKNAEGFIRFSYTNSLENIHAGLDRIELYLKRRFGSHHSEF
ncbi:MAG TPA: pyridoxal phosphate-dependent aminotransferase [Desulfomonilaceae bacterium]|nr:pyridoxal phosphate-dependent aminotransferase [Desulfomonilaceae bacterium]